MKDQVAIRFEAKLGRTMGAPKVEHVVLNALLDPRPIAKSTRHACAVAGGADPGSPAFDI
jgi:hypothetical protein